MSKLVSIKYISPNFEVVYYKGCQQRVMRTAPMTPVRERAKI